MDWEYGIGRCKLLHSEWINSKVLRYNTGNYIQYPMINHNGNEYLKKKSCSLTKQKKNSICKTEKIH